jgi:phytol kinase
MNPWLGIAGVLAALAALTVAASMARRRGLLAAEDARKLVHVVLGLCVAGFPWIFTERWPVLALAGLAVAALVALRSVPALRRRLGAALHDVSRDSWGELCFPIAAALLWCLAPGDPLRFSIPMLVLAAADAAAALIGVRYGHTALASPAGRKSWEGAAAFAITAYLAVHAPLLLLSGLPPERCLLIAACFGVLMTAVEAVSWRGLDNLFIPLVGWLLIDSWLGLPTADLAERLAVIAALVLTAAALRRRRTLDDGALAAGVLATFVAGAVGGWHWLAAPILVFAAYTIVWRAPEGGQRHGAVAVLAVALPGLIWLAAGQLGLPWRSAFAGHLACWAGAAAGIGVMASAGRGAWRAGLSGALAGPVVAAAGWLAAGAMAHDLPAAALVAASAVPAALLMLAARDLPPDGAARWLAQSGAAGAASPLVLLAGIPPG